MRHPLRLDGTRFAQTMTSDSGVISLMDDLSEALHQNPDMLMLGGGNPGQVPAVQQVLRQQMQQLLADGDRFERLVGNYGPPEGDLEFADALAALLHRHCGWNITREHIAITNGSQSLSFMLVNLFGGEAADGARREIVMPLAPEYVGYADQGVAGNVFRAVRPTLELLDEPPPDWPFDGAAPPLFKYHIDFDALHLDERTGAMLVSRPTNPSGNVITDDETARLAALAASAGVPLILDNAYGLPFPNIVFGAAAPFRDEVNEHVIVCMSLSKLGLPGVRTGIVVARPDIARAITRINAVNNLCTATFGPALLTGLVRTGEVLALANRHIRPFYLERAGQALTAFRDALHGVDYRVHVPGGAIFLWLWFPGLPITSHELYERLKARGVLVLAGESFFPGLPADDGWRHRTECIRVNYAGDPAALARGAQAIAEEVRAAAA